MNILVCQFYSSNIEYGVYAERINKSYCDKYGYDYYCEKDDSIILKAIEDRSYTWYKPIFILNIFKKYNYDYILFLDIDAVITDFSISIENAFGLHSNYDYDAFFSDDVGHHSSLNAGVFLIKNTDWSYKFLNKWWYSAYIIKPNQVRDLSISELDSDKIGYFKTALWHDQTCLTYLYDNDISIKNKIKVLDRSKFNNENYFKNEFIFHGYAKAFFRNRCLDVVENTLFNNEIDRDINLIVYHVYCFGEYKKLVSQQFNRLKKSGLYDWCDTMEITVIGNNSDFILIEDMFIDYKKININFYKNNTYEYYAIDLIWKYSQKYNGKVFYFHTKGVFNVFKDFKKRTISSVKKKSIESWRNVMEYFLIDNFRDCLDSLDSDNQCGVHFEDGWWYGNFWWSTLEWIRNNGRPNFGDRWYFEAWLNFGRLPKFKELYHFNFDTYFTTLDLNLLIGNRKDRHIELKYARYGYPIQPVNESTNFDYRNVDNFYNVSNIILKNLEENNFSKIDILVSNNIFGDPCFNHPKILHIWIVIDGRVYIVSQKEDKRLYIDL